MSGRKRQTAKASFGSRTDIGCIREHNEDSLLVAAPLYVVCDGMGGHAAGEVAAEIAVDIIAKRAPKIPDANELGQAVEEANLAVIKAAAAESGREGMGCTCTAAVLENERLVIAQVGDSRAYLLHDGKLQQITHDHSLVADLIEAGQITAEQAKTHPQRSVITRALGSDPFMQPDLFEINVETGDRLLLCSDGLTCMVDDSAIEDTMRRVSDPQLTASKLVSDAIACGGHDNVTVIVVDVTGFAEAKLKRIARKTKITAAFLIVAFLAIFAAAAYGLNYWINTSAYLGESDGKVAIYRGIPGSIFGLSFSGLESVSDIPLDELQPGVAARIKEESIRTDSVAAAEKLVESYRADIESSNANTPAPQNANGQDAESGNDETTEAEEADGEEKTDTDEAQDATESAVETVSGMGQGKPPVAISGKTGA